MPKKNHALLLWIIGFGLFISTAASALPTQQLTILHTNDCHGYAYPFDYYGYSGFMPGFYPDVGGIARRATLINQLRGEATNPVALVDAGDFWYYYQDWWNSLYGEPDTKAMNLMSYDALGIGNHDLQDLGPESIDHFLSNVALSDFPWLSANLISTETGEPFPEIPPYIVKTFGDLRVGFLGLTTPEYIAVTMPECDFVDPFEAAAYWAPIAREECDVLIVISHLGLWDDEYLAATVSGIDAIIGGHSHAFLDTPDWISNPDGIGVPIVQAGESGVVLGKFDLTFEQQDTAWRLIDAQEELIPIDNTIAEDPEVTALLDSYAGTPSDPGPAVTAPQVSTSPVIDGDLSDWNEAHPILLGNEAAHHLNYPDWEGLADCSASAWFTWDDDYLYFAADITDDHFVQEMEPDLFWLNDSLQMLFDPFYDRVANYFDRDDRGYIWALSDSVAVGGRYQGTPTGWTTSIDAAGTLKEDGTGWTLEMAIPWSELRVTPAEGLKMGFSWSVNDSDTGEDYGDLEWTPFGIYYGDPSAFGSVELAPPAEHTLTVTASANPSLLASGGATLLSASAIDSKGHDIASWSWSDHGAGGIFSPSAEVQNPTYTAPGNYSGATLQRHLTVTATCDGDEPISDSAQVYINETTSSHYLRVAASATPGVIASGGSSSLRSTATDSSHHTIVSWSWSDNGAGGTFTPSAEVQNPTWTGPGNNSQVPVTRTFTVTATCSEGISNSGNVALTENPAPHSLTVTATAEPGNIASEGETQLTASAQDNYGHDIAGWSWTDHGAGGTFSPSAAVQNPTYTGPGSTTLTLRQLTVTATCDGASAVSGSAEVDVWEGDLSDTNVIFPAAGTYLFSLPAKNPDRVDGRWVLEEILSDPSAVVSHATGEVATWSAVAQAYTYGTLEDLLSPGQGYFMEVDGPCAISLSGVPFELYSYVQAEWNLLGAPTVAVDIRSLASTGQPTSGPWTWNAALQDYEKSYILTPGLGYWVKFPTAGAIGTLTETTSLMSASASDEKPSLDNAATLMDFSDVTSRHWAYNGVTLLRWLGITGGAANDNALNKTGQVTPVKSKTKFKPTGSITRGQLAVFLGRAFDLPISPDPQLDYADVTSDYWAAGYIEAVTRLGIMGEYPGKPGYFYAKKKVTRADLAFALAHAAGLPLPASVPVVFSDVPADYWAAAEIAALSTQGVLAGDPSLSAKFNPTKPANRAQLAFYLYKLLDEVR